MKLDVYQVDAFSDVPLQGNPAAVCPLTEWLPEKQMLAIARENNQAETAFFVPDGDDFQLRWFTPEVEVDLCGHATLATAWTIFNELKVQKDKLVFHTKGGVLSVERRGEKLAMSFPLTRAEPIEPPQKLLSALGIERAEVLQARDFIVIVDDERVVSDLSPDFTRLKDETTFGVSVTAPGTDVDFVSRWFGPSIGVNEDITTGSTHTWLAAYWGARLGKTSLTARQGGVRKGTLTCELAGDRVILVGAAATYLVGKITVPG